MTSTYHTPWDSPDDHTTLGDSTESEAMQADQKHYNSDQIKVSDGWESRWRRDSANNLILHGEVDDSEDESETCEITIPKFQQKRKKHTQVVEVQYKPTPRDCQYVYVVREEHRMNVGADDVQIGLYNEDGDLRDIQLHGIYKTLDAANEAAREIYDDRLEELGDDADTIEDKLKRGMVTILVVDRNEETTYLITVEKMHLL